MEAVFVAGDACERDPDEAEAVMRWAALALLQAALGEARSDGDGKG